MPTITRDDRPLRVWHYRGWCFICRNCQKRKATEYRCSGFGFASQADALAAGLEHLRNDRGEVPPSRCERRLSEVIAHFDQVELGPVLWRRTVVDRLRRALT